MTVPSNLVPTSILQLPEDPSPSDTGWMIYVHNGVTYRVQVSAVLNVSGVPTTRTITTGAGLTGGGDLSTNRVLSVAVGGIGYTELAAAGVTPGVYGSSSAIPVVTVDQTGRVTAATTTPFSVAGFVPDTRQVIAGTGLTGGGALNANITLNSTFSNAAPLALGASAAGTANISAREGHVHPAVNLASVVETTGVLGMVSGGTGVAHTAPAAGSVAYSDGAGIQLTTVGLTGQVLVSGGASPPSWGSALIVSDQSANVVYAGPVSGPAAPTGFRELVNADLQYSSITLNGNTVSLGGAATVTATATNALTIGTGLSGTSYDGSAPITVAIASTGVVAASVGSASKTLTATVNAQGQLTALADTSIAISNTQVSGLGSAALLTAGAAGGVATLDGGGTVPTSQLPAVVLGAVKYQGTWNATTNTPTLASGVGSQGYYYVVSVAGSTNLDGITSWSVGDWAIYNGTAWQKIDNTDAVTSVNGYTGTVVLSATDVGATSATSGTSILYGNGSGGTSNVTVGTGLSFAGGTLSASGGEGVVGPASSTDNAVARFDLTTGKLLQNSVVTIDDSGNAASMLSTSFADGTAVALAAGKMWYNGTTGSWNMGMGGGNITQQVGEEIFVYGKASAAITEGQLVMKTGTVGASDVITFAPTTAGITDDNLIIGIATENISLNDFGRVTAFGVVHGIDTSAFADNDILWYNPSAGSGSMTTTKPSAPNVKCEVGTVINAGAGGSGSIQVLIIHGSTLGGTDSNVQFSSVANNNLIKYDAALGYWINASSIDGVTIGSVSAAAGTFTTCTATSFSGINGGTF